MLSPIAASAPSLAGAGELVELMAGRQILALTGAGLSTEIRSSLPD